MKYPRALYEVLEEVVLAIVANYPQLSGAETTALKTRLLQIIADRDGVEPGPTEIAGLLHEVMNRPSEAGDQASGHESGIGEWHAWPS